jgi:hypothetical protein
MNTAFAAALLDPALPCPGRLRAWNGSDATRRFSVHRNNVVGSLVDALADTFPVVQALVGTEFFGAMAAGFVRAQPPRSPLMHRYGGELPAFIEGFAPARSLPYLSDVARLEFARVQACHAADAQPLTAELAGAVLASGVDLAALRPVLHPALRWLRFRASGGVAVGRAPGRGRPRGRRPRAARVRTGRAARARGAGRALRRGHAGFRRTGARGRRPR